MEKWSGLSELSWMSAAEMCPPCEVHCNFSPWINDWWHVLHKFFPLMSNSWVTLGILCNLYFMPCEVHWNSFPWINDWWHVLHKSFPLMSNSLNFGHFVQPYALGGLAVGCLMWLFYILSCMGAVWNQTVCYGCVYKLRGHHPTSPRLFTTGLLQYTCRVPNFLRQCTLKS